MCERIVHVDSNVTKPTRSSGLIKRVLSRRGNLTFSDAVDRERKVKPPPRLTWACELAEPLSGKRVADIGCWTGDLLSLLASRDALELAGIDIAGPWISVAEEALPAARFFEVADLRELPVSLRRHFDVVMLLETLEHLPRASEPAALRSLASILSPEGTLILSTPAAGIAAFLDPAWLLVGHRHYRRDTLQKLLSSAGLEVQRVHYSGNVWTSLDTVALYVAKHLLRRPYSTPSLVAALEPDGLYGTRRIGSANIWIEARSKQ
jgi:2-polyprenyl-3-methyl-5-hydroxy-6-metoxy-1,4-benzoquinol methylase